MPDDFSTIVKTWSETGKNLFALLRDALLFLLLLLLVGCPAVINDRLHSTGLQSIEGPGFRWEREVREAKQQGVQAVAAVEEVRQETREALAAVDRIAQENPGMRAQVAPIQLSLRQADQRLNATGNRLDSAVAAQQDILSQTTAETVEGWVSLNFVRVNGRPQPGAEGTTHSRPLRVRAAANSASDVRTILPVGTSVEIHEVRGNFARVTTR